MDYGVQKKRNQTASRLVINYCHFFRVNSHFCRVRLSIPYGDNDHMTLSTNNKENNKDKDKKDDKHFYRFVMI